MKILSKILKQYLLEDIKKFSINLNKFCKDFNKDIKENQLRLIKYDNEIISKINSTIANRFIEEIVIKLLKDNLNDYEVTNISTTPE